MYQFTIDELIILGIKAILETVLLFFVGYWLWRKTDLKKILSALPYKTFCFFILAWTGIQLVDRWQYFFPQKISYFPLARFAMYQAGKRALFQESYRWRVTTNSGEEKDFNIIQAFRAIGLPSLNTRMETLKRDLLSDSETKQTRAQLEVVHWAKSIKRIVEFQEKSIVKKVTFFQIKNENGVISEREIATKKFGGGW